MKLLLVVGARPQFIKAASIYRALPGGLDITLVHTGQHYDENMSEIFFQELDIPEPAINLGIGSGLHGAQTGAMLTGIETILLAEKPNKVVVFGDTNSTVAGGLAAVKLGIHLAHVEAGLRSFNRQMPEEINRVVTDHISNTLFCPSQTAVDNLAREGILSGVNLVGDVMGDVLAFAVEQARGRFHALDHLGIHEKEYYLATIHRAENTDNPQRLRSILSVFEELEAPVIFPVHPRTFKAMKEAGLVESLSFGSQMQNIKFIEPLGYLDMVQLEACARLILTDSGGIQKEAYWLKVPCVTLREETEWVETVQVGWNVLVGVDTKRIIKEVQSFVTPSEHPELYSDGQAAKRCVAILLESMAR
jgi:UDP-GlcNAc3NAcA epimerase